MSILLQDLKYGLRMLARSPSFTVIAVLTLALGIGANTAIFSLVDAVLLKMLPVRSPEQLVRLETLNPQIGPNDYFSYPAFREIQDQNQGFSGVLAFRVFDKLDLAVGGQPGLAKVQVVSGSYYQTLGVSAVLGRLIIPEDDRTPGGAPVAVISYSCWTARFNRDPSAVGKGITLNGSPFTVIGVTPDDFFGLQPGESVDVSIPITMIAQLEPGFAAAGTPYSTLAAPFRNWICIMARLEPGISERKALANLEPIYARARREAADGLGGAAFDSPAARKMFLDTRVRLEPGSRGLTALREQFSKPLLVLMAIVGLLLLIACANVANLLLTRANARQKEVALRLALGARPARLLRQLLTESVLLAAVSCVLGLVFALWGSSLLLGIMSRSPSPVVLNVEADARVMGFTMLVSLAAAIVFGLAPSWQAPRLELSTTLKESGINSGTGRQRAQLGRTLAVVQVALSLVLLAGAALLVRSLRNLQDLNPGFNRENVLLFTINPSMVGYRVPQLLALYDRLQQRMGVLPGVRTMSFSMFSPLSPRFGNTEAKVEGYTSRPGESRPVSINFVGPGYFKTLGTEILLGREFTDGDRAGAGKVAVINQAMARFFFGDSNPLGRRFSIPGWVGDDSMLEIVGVAEDSKNHSLREQTPPAAYIPFLQAPGSEALTFEIRTTSNPASLIDVVRRIVEEADSRLPVFDVKTLAQQVDDSLVQEHLVALLSTLFGALALLLTCVGLYGLIAYSVARRTHEIGIRMALGARQTNVLKLVVGEGLRLTLSGVAMGIAGGLVLTRFLTSLLYGVRPSDPITFVAVSLILVSVTLVASYIPARRATKVDPIVALRYE